MATRKRVSGLIRRLWIIQVDHSVAGVFKTKAEAERAAARRRSQTRSLDPFVVGPYVLETRKPPVARAA